MKLTTDKTGVVVVDIQGDFTEYRQGALAVPGTGQDYIELVGHAVQKFRDKGMVMFATRDYHPRNHVSFFSSHPDRTVMDVIEINGRYQVLWPPHCVTGTPNAALLVDSRLFKSVVKKGCDPAYDSYSGFFDDGGAATGLDKQLKSCNLETLVVFGLATDYCVKATALDAVSIGFHVVLAKDLCRGVALETTRTALAEMAEAGVVIAESADIL